jgi:hypothetical protein
MEEGFDINAFHKSMKSIDYKELNDIVDTLFAISTNIKERANDLFGPLLQNDIVAHAKALEALEEEIGEIKMLYGYWGF